MENGRGKEGKSNDTIGATTKGTRAIGNEEHLANRCPSAAKKTCREIDCPWNVCDRVRENMVQRTWSTTLAKRWKPKACMPRCFGLPRPRIGRTPCFQSFDLDYEPWMGSLATLASSKRRRSFLGWQNCLPRRANLSRRRSQVLELARRPNARFGRSRLPHCWRLHKK